MFIYINIFDNISCSSGTSVHFWKCSYSLWIFSIQLFYLNKVCITFVCDYIYLRYEYFSSIFPWSVAYGDWQWRLCVCCGLVVKYNDSCAVFTVLCWLTLTVVLFCGVWCVVVTDSGVVVCGLVCCGDWQLWCGVVWCGVVWCGVVWCGVVWCGDWQWQLCVLCYRQTWRVSSWRIWRWSVPWTSQRDTPPSKISRWWEEFSHFRTQYVI